MPLRLTKHHGLGNDFLVLAGDHQPDADLARAVCHRTRGIGADGLLYLTAVSDGTAEVSMVLLNADGSRAEMSGNGIGCLVQAAVLGAMADGPLVRVATDAGLRLVDIEVAGGGRHDADAVTVGMGPVTVADDVTWEVDGIDRALRVEVGNPHLVLLPADAALVRDREWLAEVGAKANATIAGGVNVEVIAGSGGDTAGGVDMDVYERGVGLTDACGTGAVAAAVAAQRWGLVAEQVAVTMHGGTVGVALAGDEPLLTTTIAYVGAIEYPW